MSLKPLSFDLYRELWQNDVGDDNRENSWRERDCDREGLSYYWKWDTNTEFYFCFQVKTWVRSWEGSFWRNPTATVAATRGGIERWPHGTGDHLMSHLAIEASRGKCVAVGSVHEGHFFIMQWTWTVSLATPISARSQGERVSASGEELRESLNSTYTHSGRVLEML